MHLGVVIVKNWRQRGMNWQTVFPMMMQLVFLRLIVPCTVVSVANLTLKDILHCCGLKMEKRYISQHFSPFLNILVFKYEAAFLYIYKYMGYIRIIDR